MNKITDTMKTTEFIRSSIRERLRDKKSITIVELCKLVINEIVDFFKPNNNLSLETLGVEEISLLCDYKWSAQKVINKHERFNETGQRGHYLYHFNNLRDLLDLGEEWTILIINDDVINLSEFALNTFGKAANLSGFKFIIAQNIEPKRKENQTH